MVWCLHPDITENIKETLIPGNLRCEFICNNHFYNIGMC